MCGAYLLILGFKKKIGGRVFCVSSFSSFCDYWFQGVDPPSGVIEFIPSQKLGKWKNTCIMLVINYCYIY